jgi:hypothetical protein
MWEHRNGVIHDTENIVTRPMVIHLNDRVSKVYNDLSSRVLRHNDRHLVHLSLYKLLSKDNNYKVTWLSVTEPALRQRRQDQWQERTQHNRMIRGMRRGLLSWLQNNRNNRLTRRVFPS